jgi:septum formation protein
LTKNKQCAELYLASRSPRRQELLQQIHIGFHLLDVEVPEIPHQNEAAEIFVQRMALAKARAGLNQLKKEDPLPVLGADTVVVVDGDILGKPRDKSDAINMLQRLSNREHEVFSSVVLMNHEKKVVKLNRSKVMFRSLSNEDIDAYWASGECQDKAGAYGIQGKAAVFIKNLNGSYSGVMGLPLYETSEILQLFGISPVK